MTGAFGQQGDDRSVAALFEVDADGVVAAFVLIEVAEFASKAAGFDADDGSYDPRLDWSRSKTAVPMTNSLRLSAEPAMRCSTTKRRNLRKRSERANAELAEMRSTCLRISAESRPGQGSRERSGELGETKM
jgi:hypothetical protein